MVSQMTDYVLLNLSYRSNYPDHCFTTTENLRGLFGIAPTSVSRELNIREATRMAQYFQTHRQSNKLKKVQPMKLFHWP